MRLDSLGDALLGAQMRFRLEPEVARDARRLMGEVGADDGTGAQDYGLSAVRARVGGTACRVLRPDLSAVRCERKGNLKIDVCQRPTPSPFIVHLATGTSRPLAPRRRTMAMPSPRGAAFGPWDARRDESSSGG